MSPRSNRRLIVAATAAVAVLFASTTAGAQNDEGPEVSEVRGYAAGVHLHSVTVEDDFFFEMQVDPTPEVVLPPDGGGPFTDSLGVLIAEANTGQQEQVATDLEVSTEGALGPDGFATASASLENLFTDTEGPPFLSADSVDVECHSDMDEGPTGSTTIVNGTAVNIFEDIDIEIPESPEPNTVLFDVDQEIVEDVVTHERMRIVVNEQVTDGNDISVVGIRVELAIDLFDLQDNLLAEQQLEMVIGETSCGFDLVEAETPAEELEPAETDTDDVTAADALTPATATPRFTG